MADDLFGALRQHLAHVYDTKLIKAGRHEFGIHVGWGAHRHMSFLRDRQPHGLYLNVKTMWADFDRILSDAAKQLTEDETPMRARHMIKDAHPKAIPGWTRLLAEASAR